MTDPLEPLAAELRLDLLRPTDLPDLAVELVLAGYESLALYELAGLTRTDVTQAASLARAALDELGVQWPSDEDALWMLVRLAAQRAVDGVLPVMAAAERISEVWWSRQEGDAELDMIAAFAACDGDSLVDRSELERKTLAALERLLARR